MMLKNSLMVLCSAGAFALFAAPGCSSSATSDAGPGGDAADLDSGTKSDVRDTGTKPDTGPSPAVCPEPADVSAFSPGVPQPVRNADPTACKIPDGGGGDYQAYYDACYAMGATAQTCQAWQMANDKCYKCIASQDTDAQWGLIVEGGGVASINVAGCLELVGDHGCAVAYSNLKQCQDLGCKAQCPVTDTPSFTLYTQCITKVTAGGCKKYNDASNLACTADASPNVGKCTGSGGFQGLLVKLGPVFCGQ